MPALCADVNREPSKMLGTEQVLRQYLWHHVQCDFLEVELTYNVILVLDVQQSDSTCIYNMKAHPDRCGYHLSSCKVIKILLTIFAMLDFLSL